VLLVGLLLLLAAAGGLLALYLDPGPAGRGHTITSEVEFPEQIITRGGTGPLAWWLVASGFEINHRDATTCTEVRDPGGTRSPSACGYHQDDGRHGNIDYNQADLPDGRYIWFGPTPGNATTALLRFRDGQVAQVPTVSAPGLPGRFFYYVAQNRPDPYPIVIVFDGDGYQIDV
jgi:hypothetical protein